MTNTEKIITVISNYHNRPVLHGWELGEDEHRNACPCDAHRDECEGR